MGPEDLEEAARGIMVAPVQERLDKVTTEALVQIPVHAGVVAVVGQVLLVVLEIQAVMLVAAAQELLGQTVLLTLVVVAVA